MQEDLLYFGQLQMLINNNNTYFTFLFIISTFLYNNYYNYHKEDIHECECNFRRDLTAAQLINFAMGMYLKNIT